MKKRKISFSTVLTGFFATLLLFFSCQVGLGEAGDTRPPTITIEKPEIDKVIRDKFLISGTWEDDGTIDNTTPILQGYNYGLEIDNGKTVTIYDGIFKGNSNVNNKAINVESRVNLVNTVIRHTTETIDSIPYDVAYLENN